MCYGLRWRPGPAQPSAPAPVPGSGSWSLCRESTSSAPADASLAQAQTSAPRSPLSPAAGATVPAFPPQNRPSASHISGGLTV